MLRRFTTSCSVEGVIVPRKAVVGEKRVSSEALLVWSGLEQSHDGNYVVYIPTKGSAVRWP